MYGAQWRLADLTRLRERLQGLTHLVGWLGEVGSPARVVGSGLLPESRNLSPRQKVQG